MGFLFILSRLERLYYSTNIFQKSCLQFVCGPCKILFIVNGVNLTFLQVYTQNSDPETIYDLHMILTIVLQVPSHICDCNISLPAYAFIHTKT
jgi:hypothetical protein